MTFYVYREGVGPIYGSVPKKCVAKFSTWIDANNYVTAKNEHWFGIYRFWMTDH